MDLFLDLVRSSKEQLLASPFVKTGVAKMILENRMHEANVSLLTSYKLTNFYRGSSDVTAIRCLLEGQADVRSHPRLHAKAYIFDAKKAFVTSANLTLGGLRNNYECGVLVDDPGIVAQLRSGFLSLFQDLEETSQVSSEVVAVTEEILSKVPEEKRIVFEKSDRDLFPEPEDDLYDGGIATITDSLTGWRLDIFKVISAVRGNVFKLHDVYAHKDRLAQLHPDNLNIEAKIRQQLQELRDLGLVEFLGGGVYRKLWRDG